MLPRAEREYSGKNKLGMGWSRCGPAHQITEKFTDLARPEVVCSY